MKTLVLLLLTVLLCQIQNASAATVVSNDDVAVTFYGSESSAEGYFRITLEITALNSDIFVARRPESSEAWSEPAGLHWQPISATDPDGFHQLNRSAIVTSPYVTSEDTSDFFGILEGHSRIVNLQVNLQPQDVSSEGMYRVVAEMLDYRTSLEGVNQYIILDTTDFKTNYEYLMAPIPEPTTALLVGIGGLLCLRRRR